MPPGAAQEVMTENAYAEEDNAADRAVLALGPRPARWSRVATREQRRGYIQVFVTSAKVVKVEDGDLYDSNTDNCV